MAASLGRTMAMWLGSFLTVASLLAMRRLVPLVPLLLAGVLTGAITLIRFFYVQRKSR